MRLHILAALPVLALAGCGAQSTMPPTSSAQPSSALGAQQPASKEPESANSLPNGSQVNTTLTPNAGNVNTTRVGPAVRRAPTSGY